MTKEQEAILKLTDDEGAAKVLLEIWNQINGEPLAAARMLRAFQGAKSVIDETLKELPAKWEQLEKELTNADLHRARFTQDLIEFRSSSMKEINAAKVDLEALQDFFLELDEDKFLNRANRVLDLCERLSKAKRDGTLEWIKTVLTP